MPTSAKKEKSSKKTKKSSKAPKGSKVPKESKVSKESMKKNKKSRSTSEEEASLSRKRRRSDVDSGEEDGEDDDDDEGDEEQDEQDDEGDGEEDDEKKASASDRIDASGKVKNRTDEELPTTFAEAGVCAPLCESISAMGWKTPSRIQAESLPHSLAGRDIIGLAETGSGKTGAFAIPVLQSLLDKPQPHYALVLSPTRELAVQIAEQFEALGSTIGLKCAVIVGGIDMMTQQLALARRPHVIVATPGRLQDHLENTKGFHLRYLKYLIIDEADKLLNMDFEKEINAILKVIPRERSTYLFSATMTNKVAKLQRASLSNPVRVEVSSKFGIVKNLISHYIFMPAKYSFAYLAYLLNEYAGQSSIVFVASCAGAHKTALTLRNLGFRAVPLHGRMSQPKRLGALNKFKSGSHNILVATDVAARGLDIPSVDLVINADVPTNPKDYVHRVGRTARAGRSGRAVTFVTQYDVETYQKIEAALGTKLDKFPCEERDVLLLQERVNEAVRFATAQMKEDEAAREEGGRKRGGGGGGGGRKWARKR